RYPSQVYCSHFPHLHATHSSRRQQRTAANWLCKLDLRPATDYGFLLAWNWLMKLSLAQFEPLALEQMDMLYRVARRLTHDPAKAEDLVQETYLRAFSARE